MSTWKDKKEEDLKKAIRENEEALRVFRFALSGSKIRNVRQGRGLRKEIARIKTELSSRPKA